MNETTVSQDDVKEYYGETLKTNEDLKTSACCLADTLPAYLRPLVSNIHEEVLDKFYGCGSPIPHALEGMTALDLGCGTGRDVYLLSQLVGENGKVIGIDMTEEQLAVAKRHVRYHMDKFGYRNPNVELHLGFIEDLSGIADGSVDFVTSNCVINLSPDKKKVFSEIFRVLKPGGELYFSDVFAGSRIPTELLKDKILLGECLAGAMYIEDFRRMLQNLGCLDHRTVSKTVLHIEEEEVNAKIGMIDFYSIAVRAFKCEFEDIYENYGHAAIYNGSIAESPDEFILDDHHAFKSGEAVEICGNTAKMLSETRYKDFFTIEGDFSTHYGPFDCQEKIASQGACC